MGQAAVETHGAHDEGRGGRDFLIYQALAPLSAWLVGLLPLTPKSHLADAATSSTLSCRENDP